MRGHLESTGARAPSSGQLPARRGGRVGPFLYHDAVPGRSGLEEEAEMTVVERHDEGTFCWIEVAATDQAGLDFYPRMFGWDGDTQPVPGGSYTLFSLGGRPVAGGFLLGEEQIASGMPAHWNLYVGVAGVDATVA